MTICIRGEKCGMDNFKAVCIIKSKLKFNQKLMYAIFMKLLNVTESFNACCITYMRSYIKIFFFPF